MRRARIKVPVTVPARRKQTADNKEGITEADNDDISRKIVDTEKKTEMIVACLEDSKEVSIKTENSAIAEAETLPTSVLPKTKMNIIPRDEESLLSKPESTKATIEEISNPREENPIPAAEITERIVEEIPSSAKKILTEQVLGAEEAKVSSGLDNAPTSRISQTRGSFMRPTPRLDGSGRIRRNSIQGSGASASESEDDSRRTTSVIAKRARNDSLNSTASPRGGRDNSSGIGTSVNSGGIGGGASPTKSKAAISARQKRKMNVSESARKLAESRREFLLKHQDKQPDRAKLTMYDLIYYNPTTNPIKKSDAQRNSSTGNARLPMQIDNADGEKEDDEEEEDGETAESIPVPQVKVGPDGHLVLDEQSLVIEHTGAKKNRQALARTEALVDDECNGSGFYKRRQKMREWSKWETIKFYKALNTVGTDFLLMQSLFPERTRLEIKMKFKKEEKVNRRFIEKALTFHQEFDVDSLQKELATFEETGKLQAPTTEGEQPTPTRQRASPKRRKKKREQQRRTALSVGEESTNFVDENNLIEETPTSELECHESTTTDKSEKKRSLKQRSVMSGVRSEVESARGSKESESDTEIYQIRPTRSGRSPKVRKLQAPTMSNQEDKSSDSDEENEETNDNEEEKKSSSSRKVKGKKRRGKTMRYSKSDKVASSISPSVENAVPEIAQVAPGSLIIVSRESAEQPGETVLQVYMASSDVDEVSGNERQSMQPIILTPELLNTVTSGMAKVAPIDVEIN